MFGLFFAKVTAGLNTASVTTQPVGEPAAGLVETSLVTSHREQGAEGLKSDQKVNKSYFSSESVSHDREKQKFRKPLGNKSSSIEQLLMYEIGSKMAVILVLEIS